MRFTGGLQEYYESLFVPRLGIELARNLNERHENLLLYYSIAKSLNDVSLLFIYWSRFIPMIRPQNGLFGDLSLSISVGSLLVSKVASDILVYKMGLRRHMLDLATNTYF
ncbi:MAG: hypothetical protein COT84_07180 [Chlamydiae bacterium CG10_big_fil_rev_8_21_14_0_10_35_9]|nr:MAG: hypothetical protein COT84_07180 [Chlamydiae bacterium CG10_big_fil_rev_8_21_14_0_10_35_9]